MKNKLINLVSTIGIWVSMTAFILWLPYGLSSINHAHDGFFVFPHSGFWGFLSLIFFLASIIGRSASNSGAKR